MIQIDDVAIGGDEVTVIAGPCSVESEEQTLEAAHAVKAAGAKLLRGGAYKPRTSNTLDVSAVPVIQSMSHLPVFIDPSHAAGKRAFVPSLALAGIAAGADGLMIEIHPNPDMAMSDGAQSLDFTEFASLMPKMSAVADTMRLTPASRPSIASQTA